MMKNTQNTIIVNEQINSQLWKLFDILRGSSIEDLQIVFLLISAYKDGVFQSRNSNESKELAHFIIDCLYHSDKYFEIFQVYEPIVQLMSPERLDAVYEYLHRINGQELNVLRSNFSEIFETLLNKYLVSLGKRSGEVFQPFEISRFVMNLANLNENASVYNPFAGLGSYGIFLAKGQKYYGQEINEKTWALGMLRFLAHNNSNDVYYSSKDSFEDFKGSICYDGSDSIDFWLDNKKFDLIVSTPPLKHPISGRFQSQLTGEPYRTIENFLVDKGIHSLKNNGKLIAMFSLSFLFSAGREGQLKRRLIENDLIDTIVLLPSGLLSNTNIPVCILVFKKISRRPGYVRFINASTFFTKDGPRNKFLNDKDLYKLISDDIENEFLRYVSYSEIYENDFDLSVARYFLKDVQGEKLSSFTSIIRGTNAPQNIRMRQVHIKHLKDDVFNCVLKSDEIDFSLIKRSSFRIIEESCVLLATRWITSKPTYFEYTGEPIVISDAIVALRLNKNVVDPIFLINEFSADYVKEQLDGYRIGTVQPMLRKKDLQNIKIQLLSIEEQRAKVSGIIELSSRLKELEADKENLLTGYKKEETESSTSLSHILGKPLLSIGSSLEIIQNALSKLDPNWKDIMISENKQFKMSDAFESISKNVKYIQELADENTSLVSVSTFDLTEVRFLKFLSEIVKNEKKSLKNNLELKLDVHEDIREQMDNQVIIKGNEQKLRIVLINLIDNAKNHAFKEIDKNNKINIEILPFTGNVLEASYLNYDIDEKKSYVEVKVSNTGKPFPKDFTLDDYVRKNFAAGKTRNRGLGGYEVNEILKVHNEGKKALNLVSTKGNQEYSSTLSFIIPVI